MCCCNWMASNIAGNDSQTTQYTTKFLYGSSIIIICFVWSVCFGRFAALRCVRDSRAGIKLLPVYKHYALHHIRKEYNLDGPGRINEAIDILEEWVKKQEHFTVKIFPRSLLERVIINNKGSLESCKRKMDRACTFRTLIPDFFENINLNDYTAYKMFTNGLLPKMTPDYGRVIIVKGYGDNFEKILEYYKFFILVCEYIQTYDYITGVSYIMDCKQMNIIEFVKSINLFDLKKAIDISVDAYSLRIKGIHILSDSKAVDLLVVLLRQAFSAKIGKRIHCHSTMESLYEKFPKDILPEEYGGSEKCIPDLRDELLNEIRSSDFIAHCDAMKRARTNEDLRPKARFNEEYMGMSGTFRSLTVD